MKILITGANGFVGKNLTAALAAIRDGKDRTHPELCVEDLFLYDLSTDCTCLEEACRQADFVFHLAGVNRPKCAEEFQTGNVDFLAELLEKLEKYENRCPVMLASSVQASLLGRYAEGDYGKSKRAGEELLFAYGQRTDCKTLIYRFPNLFGKWCRPNYNSVVATFCYNMARELPITVNDPSVELELLYIDDLVDEMMAALAGREHRCEYDGLQVMHDEQGAFCFAPVTHRVALGEMVELLESFCRQPKTLLLPDIPNGSFAKKLYSTYLSYLPAEKIAFDLDMKCDARGSFTEVLRTVSNGQFSVNVSKPGITKGEHWHHTKWEFFMVVSGHGLIRQRCLGSDEVLEFEVTGERHQAVHLLPGYTHSLVNLSDCEDLVTVMWANECFDPAKPDTFFEKV